LAVWYRFPKPLLLLATIAFFLFLAAQFVRPEIANPPVTADLQVPSEVKGILQTSCYNCHSNQTRLFWFDQVAPAYWFVARDVREGRKHLNFSDFARRPAAQQKAILYEAVNQIRLRAMPLRNYQAVHPESRVTQEQLTILENYLNPPKLSIPSTSKDVESARSQFDAWMQSHQTHLAVQPAPNGMPFIPEYKDWKAIGSTERFDNHTMRVILGNEIAVKAIEAGQINPWPDGSSFAKVAWDQLADEHGAVRPGAFKQVEFMTKDSKKYASTLGWNWGRWLGMSLKPYGNSAAFVNECVGCHRPLQPSDYVFTKPMRASK
jgi:Haem-binding domain/Cytochrome P460